MIDFQPIDETNNIDFQPIEDEEKKAYKRPAGDKGWEISATPKEDTTLIGRIGKALRWVAQTPIKAYSQGEKNIEAAELNAKEMFQPLSDTEKNKLNMLESAKRDSFGTPSSDEELKASHTGDMADWASEGGPERFSNARKRGYSENFENLAPSVAVMKAGGIGSAVVGGIGALGGALWGLRKGQPVEGALEGFNVGIRLGGGSGAARKSFELEAGFARQELKQMRDKDGNPLPENLINKASMGVGVVNAGLEMIGLDAELKTFPGMDKIFKSAKKDLIKEVVENETLRNKLLNAGGQLLKSTATESSTEMIQQCSNILADELSKKIAGNYDDTMFEDGKINMPVLRSHIGEVVQAGVSAIGPSMIIGGIGTAMTAANILRKNGMPQDQAKTVAETMNVDERANFINENLDTLGEVAKEHITDIEAQDIEKNFFDKASEVYKDSEGNLSAEKENQVLSAAKIAGAFAKKFGSNKQQVQDWFDKLSFQNKPVETLQGGVSMDVQASKEIPFDQLTMEDIPEVQFQKSAAFAGTASKDEALDAAKAWQEQKTESPYFKKWFGDSKVVNDEGAPLVVYHGTEYGEFNEFSKEMQRVEDGFFFTNNPETAKEYAEIAPYKADEMTEAEKAEASKIHNVYLNINNPYVVDMQGEEYRGTAVQGYIDEAKELGHDGVVIKNIVDKRYTESKGSLGTDYIAFSPEQIKSVVNKGTFSKDTGNIYYQKENFEKEFGDSIENIEAMLSADVQNVLYDNVTDESDFKFEGVKIYGSYLKGLNKKSSDLDLLVQYSGSMREDDAFNMFADAKLKIQNALGKDVKVDINPINTEKSGTIDEHLAHLDKLENKENTYFQSAYHGTPHKFDEFSLEHIGNGEGVQAHGYGLYFAGDKKISEEYRKALTKNDIKIGDEVYTKNKGRWASENNTNVDATLSMALNILAENGSKGSAIKTTQKIFNNYMEDGNLSEARIYQNILDVYQNENIDFENRGQLFEVDIPEGNVLLDEDEILQEQDENVQKLINNLLEKEDLKDWYDSLDHDLTGGEFYQRLGKMISMKIGRAEKTSKLLNQYGIKGITYNGREDGRCYVVFDDKAIDVVKTYYQDKKSLDDLHEDNAINKKQKALEYLGYFKEGQDKNIIGIMQDANPSTIVHEMGHLFLQGLNEFSQTDTEAKSMLEEVNEWLGYTGEGYTVDQHEKFARGFEAYLYNGKAPSNTLREVFENFKEWLRSIYNHVDELGVNLTPEVQRIFDNMFSDKKEKQNPVNEMVEKAKNISINGKLSDYELRHKETAYHILSVATGKSKTWLKTILESDSENSRILKSKEKIQLLSENVEDRISGADGFLPEWSEFFFNPGIGEDTHADYQLASAAYNTIVDKTYLNNHSEQFGFLDVTEAQYQYLVGQFKKASDRDVPLAAFWDWLDTVDTDFVMTYAEKYENDVAYIERFEKMDKFAQAKEMIVKAANEAGRYSINDVDKYKNIVMATIKGLNFLSPMAKARLTANILDYSSTALLEANIDNLLDVAKTIEDVEYKKRLVYSIHKALQFTKNIKQNNKTVGKYDYQTNKIFEKMREIEALSAEEANEMRLEIGDAHEENGLSFEDKIVNSFINYKANGLTFTSTESAKAMYDDIVKMKLAGKEAKSEQDFQNKLNLASDVIELVRVLDRKKVAKLPTKWYLQIAANWESMINGIFNKEMRDKYSLLAPQRLADGWIHNEKKSFEKQVAKIYGKTMFDFDDAIIKNLNAKISFLENVEDVENVGEFRQVPREMNKMEMILAWMWDKNEVLHQRLLNQFGDIELERMFNELSDGDMKLGNLMMQTVNKYYAPANEAFIKKYGIDLPRVSNYFPSKVERISEIDLLTDFASKSTDPSATKHRSGSIGLSMDFDNPVKMLYQHVDSMGKFIHMTETLDKQNKIFKNKTLRKIIIEKYGEDIYNEMLKMFMNNAYKQEMTNYNWFSKQIDKLVSNWLIGNVAVKPSIAIKQLLSASNYASEMPYLKWKLGYLKAIADPKGTIEYMNKIPYLKARFEMGGQNEFLKNEINNSKLAKTARFKEWASANIRMGDIGAIAFGGRPYLEYLMKEKGLSEEAAIKEFLDHTQRTMQASETSTLNNFQIAMAKGGFGSKLLTAYKNAQWQYLRMAGDSIVSYSNGDMTGSQMGKTLFMYLFMNPFLYRSATSLSLVTLLATGKGDDLEKDILGSIFDLNADAIAVFGDLYQYAVGKLLLKEKGIPEKTPLVGDIQAHINNISKEDVGIEDWLDFAGYGTQVTTGVPVNSVALSLSGAGDIAQGKYLKGSLKALGWSDKRAAHASGEKEKKSKRKSKKHKLNLD